MATDRPLLYIEDNYHNRRLVRRILTPRGYRVIEAEDGRRGLEILRSQQPPLLLLDISLPEMDGLELLERLRADPALRGTPVIALTASAMAGDRERFLEAGCDDYLSKPIQAVQLLEKIAALYPKETKTATSETPPTPRSPMSGRNHGPLDLRSRLARRRASVAGDLPHP